MEAAIHPMIQVQHLNQGKYPNQLVLPILKFPKSVKDIKNNFQEKSSQVKPGMIVLDSTSFSYESKVDIDIGCAGTHQLFRGNEDTPQIW